MPVSSEKRPILYHPHCFQQPKVHVCYKLFSAPALFLGPDPKIIQDT